jgi:ATP-dependent DNA helicase RecG
MSRRGLSAARVAEGRGDRRAADLASAGLQTVEDLLVRFPLRYEDRGHPRPLAEIAPGASPQAIGTIVSATVKRTRRPGFSVFEVVLRDRSGTARAVWFNQRFLKDVLRAGQTVALLRQGGAGRRRPAVRQPAVRNPRRRAAGGRLAGCRGR